MNGYERVMAVVGGYDTDHVPVSGMLSLYGAKMIEADTVSYYHDPNLYVAGQKAVVERFDPDIIFTPFALALEAAEFGCEIKFPQDSYPFIVRRAYRSVKDVQAITMPHLKEDIYSDYFFKTAAMLKDLYKGEKAIGGIWLDPVDLLATLVGLEGFIELLFFQEAIFAQLIEKFIAHTVTVGNRLLASGADFLVIPAGVCNTATLTRDMIKKHVLPILEGTLSQIHGPVVLHNGGYKIGPYVDLYKDLPNLVGIVIDKTDHFDDAYEATEHSKVIIGNITGTSLSQLDPKHIERLCTRTLESAKGTNRLILMTSAADIPFEATEPQIEALMRAPFNFS